MKQIIVLIALCLLSAVGCSSKPQSLTGLKIASIESGPVPLSEAGSVPAAEGTVAFTHGPAGTSTAVFRKTVACPSRMMMGRTGFKVEPERILLCFEPIEANEPGAEPLSACPYNFAVKYEFTGIPASVSPKFAVVDGCTGF